MEAIQSKKQSLFPLFFTVFIDLLGVGIVIPVIAPLFLDPRGGILSMGASLSVRTMLLGFLIASYSLAQFFGAPYLGGLSDRVGRKKMLVVSLIGTLIGYLLFAIGVLTKNLILLFVARLVDGFTGGNISIAQSAPFWFAAIHCAANIIILMLRFQDSLVRSSSSKASFLTGFRNIGRAIRLVQCRQIFLVVFFLVFGFSFFTQFFQVYLIQRFAYTQSQIGDLFAYVGLWIAFSQGVVNRPLTRRFTPAQILPISALLLAISLPALLLPGQPWGLYIVLPLIALFQGLTNPSSLAVVSQLAGPSMQGEIIGINQSFTSLAQAIPPIIAGFIASLDRNLPILVAGGATLLAWILLVPFLQRLKRGTAGQCLMERTPPGSVMPQSIIR
ncbi:MAG: MFS transporter [Coprothermobacterota bacterium]|nr:MFS transporter [Coprothermobacterota bacterium]